MYLIGTEATAHDLRSSGDLDLVVDSTGGDAAELFAMAAYVKEKEATVHVTGIAAGGALLLVAAASSRTMEPGGELQFLCHSIVASGSAESIRRAGALAGEMDMSMAAAIAESSRRPMMTQFLVLGWMSSSRQMSGREVLHFGLVDEILERPEAVTFASGTLS